MAQLNLNVTREFERDLKLIMEKRKLKRKSDALRQLVHDEADKLRRKQKFNFESLMGIALKYPANPNPKFKDEDDLWS